VQDTIPIAGPGLLTVRANDAPTIDADSGSLAVRPRAQLERRPRVTIGAAAAINDILTTASAEIVTAVPRRAPSR